MKIAIIGGIGSGKSAVLSIIKEMGYETLSADEINAEMLKDPEYQAKLEGLFPGVVKNDITLKKTDSPIKLTADLIIPSLWVKR